MRSFMRVLCFVRRLAILPGLLAVLLVMLLIVASVTNPKEDQGPALRLKIDVTKALPLNEMATFQAVESHEHQAAWTDLATIFMDRWVTGKTLNYMRNHATTHGKALYRPLMPCLGASVLPDWMNHKKVFEPKFGKFIKILGSSVKEVSAETDVMNHPRYYLEAQCQWEHATSLARFTFDDNSKGQLIITGLWLARDPQGPSLPGSRDQNGYVFGKTMLRLAGYSENSHPGAWHNNFTFPVRVTLISPENTFDQSWKIFEKKRTYKKWRVKWWFDPTTSPLRSPGQQVMIDGRRWVRYYDPPIYRDTFDAASGDYRISIEIPSHQLIPKQYPNLLQNNPKAAVPGFTVFSDIISIDDSTSALEIQATVSESVEQRRRHTLRKVIAKSEQISSPFDWKTASDEAVVNRLEELICRARATNRHHCVAGLSYKTRPESADASKLKRPEDVTEIDLYAEFSIGCDCCSDAACSRITDSDIFFLGAFRSLEVLRIPWAKLEGPGLAAIKNLEKLRELELSCNSLNDQSLRHLSGLKNLETLYLCTTDIQGEGLCYLKELPKLKRLYLTGCHLSPKGWATLGTLTQLEQLAVTPFKCKEKSTNKYLKHLTKLYNLKTIEFYRGNITLRDRYTREENSLQDEMIHVDDFIHELAKLPGLKRIGFSPHEKGMHITNLRHFSSSTVPKLLNCRPNIASDRPTQKNSLTQKELDRIQRRLDTFESLWVDVDFLPTTPKLSRVAEIGNAKTLRSLWVSLDEDVTELYIHDMPNLEKLTVWIRVKYEKNGTNIICITPDIKLNRLRLENLPSLSSAKAPNPVKLIIKNVPDKPVSYLHERK